jgi:DNA-binding transcriptional LysR family regulator
MVSMGLVDDPSVTGLRVLLAVADAGSFTLAADTLGYTQSAVSKQMNTLEKAAGVALFERTARGVALTEAGRVLAARAIRIIDELEATSREIAGLDAAVTGRVALGGFPTASMVLVPRAIAVLRSQHPGLAVEFQEASTPAQLGRLRAGRLDVAIVATGAGLDDYDLSGLRTESLVTGPLVVAVPESHPFARRRRVQVAELEDQDWIVGEGARGEPQFGAWPTLVTPRVTFAVRGWPARFGFVQAGLGITTMPAAAVASAPASIRTVHVDDPSWRGRHSSVATRSDRSEAVSVVVEAIMRTSARLHAND